MNYKNLNKGDVITYFEDESRISKYCLIMRKQNSWMNCIGLTKENEIEEFSLTQRVLYHPKCKKITSGEIYDDLKKAEFLMRL